MTTPTVERKLAAIFSADVKGYSRLMGEDEVATVQILTEYRAVMARFIQEHRGRVVDAPGDNLLAEFASVVDAVACAAELQRDLRSRNADVPVSRRLEFRIGINLGDVIVDGERIYGDGVNIAARVEGMADAGGIAISGTVYDQVKGKLPLRLRATRRARRQEHPERIRVYRVPLDAPAPGQARDHADGRRTAVVATGRGAPWSRGAGAGPWRGRSGPFLRPRATALALPDKPSIAVLPFQNMSGDAGQEYFSDGMTEDLITSLSKVSGLFVIARNSVFLYKGKAVKPAQVSRDLGVRYVLEGSVRKVGNRVRITAQLIDATTGYHVWAERYDRDLQDVFALQDDVTEKIVTMLAVKLTGPEKRGLARTRAGNLEAYDLVLRGLQEHRRTTPEGSADARRLFTKAIELDPDYGGAYEALGWSYLQAWQLQWSRDPDTLQRALDMAEQAILRDDGRAGCHTLLSQVLLWKKEHDAGDRRGGAGDRAGPQRCRGLRDAGRGPRVVRSGRRGDRTYQACDAAQSAVPLLLPLDARPCLLPHREERRRHRDAQDADRAAAKLRPCPRVPGRPLQRSRAVDQKARAEWMAAANFSPARLARQREQVPALRNERDLDRLLAAMRKAGVK